MATTSQRIKEALNIRGMKQADLVEKTGIGKSSISTYISGEYNPKQKNLYKIAKTLHVNEAWLMGLDVPMERDDYEDQNIITFEAILDSVYDIIEKSGYKITISDDAIPDIIIKTKNGEIVAITHDYELVGRYLSMKEKPNFTAEDLWIDRDYAATIDKIQAFDAQLKVLGWTYKIMAEGNPKIDKHPTTYALFKKDSISFKVSGDDYDSLMNDSLIFMEKRIQQLFNKYSAGLFDSHYYANAAHTRTDIDIPNDIDTSEDDIMDDENF